MSRTLHQIIADKLKNTRPTNSVGGVKEQAEIAEEGEWLGGTFKPSVETPCDCGQADGTRDVHHSECGVMTAKMPADKPGDEPRDVERLAALELGTTVESIDQKLMVAHNRAEKAEAIAGGVRAAHLLEKIAHADTKLALWKERYNRSGEMMDKIHRERDDLQAESRGENPRWIAPERGR